jgi:hypothetical protein
MEDNRVARDAIASYIKTTGSHNSKAILQPMKERDTQKKLESSMMRSWTKTTRR